MLFDSSIRKELARSFGATLVVLVTVVMTMMLIRTLGQARAAASTLPTSCWSWASPCWGNCPSFSA
jgi:hypothetical protein